LTEDFKVQPQYMVLQSSSWVCSKSLVLKSARSITSRKIIFSEVEPKFSKFTRNACSMV